MLLAIERRLTLHLPLETGLEGLLVALNATSDTRHAEVTGAVNDREDSHLLDAAVTGVGVGVVVVTEIAGHPTPHNLGYVQVVDHGRRDFVRGVNQDVVNMAASENA